MLIESIVSLPSLPLYDLTNHTDSYWDVVEILEELLHKPIHQCNHIGSVGHELGTDLFTKSEVDLLIYINR